MLIGYLVTIASTMLYTVRFSLVKDLKSHKISGNHINFFSRVICLPFLILFLAFTSESLFNFKPGFAIWMVITLIVSATYNVFLVRIFQENDFSLVMVLEPFKIVFSVLLGLIFLGEVLTANQIVGMLVVSMALLYLVIKDSKVSLKNINVFEILIFHASTAVLALVNKKAILVSSPLIFTIYLTVGLIFIHFFLDFRHGKKLYNFAEKKTNIILVQLGILTALSFYTINLGLAYLPIAVVSTISTTKVFMSLWISHKKYKESEYQLKLLVSLVAFIGVLIMFFG